jgi:hypothetical protein
MAETPDPDVYIYFTVTKEYEFSGSWSDLPASIRKGAMKKGKVDPEVVDNNLATDEEMEKLAKISEESGADWTMNDITIEQEDEDE